MCDRKAAIKIVCGDSYLHRSEGAEKRGAVIANGSKGKVRCSPFSARIEKKSSTSGVSDKEKEGTSVSVT